MNPKRPTPRHIIIKMAKVKGKEKLKSRKRNAVIYKGGPLRLPADFSRETFQARRNWREIFKVMKSKDLNQHYFTQQGYHLKLKEK